ncbi:hypothetical protein [Deminuibacter soli]|uniref:Tetratricopeptide repeat protein n=1 Tax=Deminuibacter soli TaxID=2291815 RepID=A0A3E1NCT3_9BACT|nr:hypothetical protein [Deminuibacter soli]RFM25651.1 hypothetical protein DXN05_23875 [Deminuibacter soli]
MNNNPIKQRIAALTHHWQDAVRNFPDARIFCWMGTASVEYRMVQAFVHWHISDESDLNDIFFCFRHPFTAATAAGYGRQLVNGIGQFLEAWNEDPELVSQTGYIDWEPQNVPIAGAGTDARYFVHNLETLASKLQVKEGEERLVVALFPQSMDDYLLWSDWLEQLLLAGIPATVQLMVYDGYQYNMLQDLIKRYPVLVRKLQPDMDMFGAMNQVLEDVKAARGTDTEKQAVSLQQLILKLTEAIGQDNAQQVNNYAAQAIRLCEIHDWPQYEALVYFFVHGWHSTAERFPKALENIDKALAKIDAAVNRHIVTGDQVRYHYRIAKGNLFFMRKRFEEAAAEYKVCLQYSREGIDKQLLLGIYQMLGMALCHSSHKKDAWHYFEEGWQLFTPADEALLQSSGIVQHYAKEMLEAAVSEASARPYRERFTALWGERWEQELKQQFQTLKITQPA